MESPPLEASTKEKFDMLFGLLKGYFNQLVDNSFRHATVEALILGWLITSESARNFLQNNRVVSWFACGVVLLYATFHSTWIWKNYLRSCIAYTQLCKLGYMPSEYFGPRRIPLFMPISFMVVHWCVALLISSIIVFH
jgi:hypothetical protein